MSTVVPMKFCPECNNIMYPKEDKKQKILLYAYRLCDHQEVADNKCVYREVKQHSVDERIQVVLEDATTPQDPTLPRTKAVRCPTCAYGEAVFHRHQISASGEEGLFYVCCNPNCGTRWRN